MMPDTICRNCGTDLQVESKCTQCEKAIQQICPQCHYATFEQIHFDCTYGLEKSVMSNRIKETCHEVRENYVLS